VLAPRAPISANAPTRSLAAWARCRCRCRCRRGRRFRRRVLGVCVLVFAAGALAAAVPVHAAGGDVPGLASVAREAAPAGAPFGASPASSPASSSAASSSGSPAAAVFAGRSGPVAGERPLERAVGLLAESVGTRLTAEVRRRELERPEPLVLRVRGTERPVQAPPEVVFGDAMRFPLEGTSIRITEIFRALPHRQLVILGAPGAGKSVLVMQLVSGLLRGRPPGDPVPVLLPLSSWDGRLPLRAWMVDRLLEDHELLEEYRDLVPRMIDSRKIIPVLDGLDEITRESFESVIRRVEFAFDSETPFALTCRTADYENAVTEFGDYLSHAAAIEIKPVAVDDAKIYLKRSVIDETHWQPVLNRLDALSDGPLAKALATPLMLFLAQTVYGRPGSAPHALLAYTEPDRIETHLLDGFLPAVYAEYLNPPYKERKARRWLSTLATGPREMRWWNFTSRVADIAVGLVFALGAGWIFHLMWNIWATVVGVVLVWFILVVTSKEILENRVEIIATEREAADPRSHLRRYRTLAACIAAASGIAVGTALGAWFAGALGANSVTTFKYGIVSGTLFGTATLLSTAWGHYVLGRLWLTTRRWLSLHLEPFIKDANQRGVLRRPGAAYEFRHPRLQDRLRSRSPVSLSLPRHTVLPSRTSRLRRITALFFVPSIRLCIHVFVVLVPILTLDSYTRHTV
jgi:uncharacterized membrane protein (Fun14 family)